MMQSLQKLWIFCFAVFILWIGFCTALWIFIDSLTENPRFPFF